MIRSYLSLLRVRQWVKNGFVLVPLFFGFELGNTPAVWRAGSAFIVFCLVSSAVYIFNDWRDLAADREHVKKKLRPLASGRVPVPVALTIMAALVVAAAAALWFARLPPQFAAMVGLYLAINLGYSLGLKHVPVLELYFVASGFLIRLIAGAYAIDIKLSPWIVIATGMLSLMAAVGKRRGDIVQANDPARRRKSLEGYNLAFLDAAMSALTGGTIVVYLLFCVSDYATARYGEEVLITAAPVSYGLLRYLQLVIVEGRGEAPTDLALSDRGMLAAVAAFGLTFLYLIYF